MASSPDSPAERREDDALRRWALAQTIYNLISNSPAEWSLRIGVYGGWGEGKTSVLKFIEANAKAHQVRVVWFNEAWQAQNREELWQLFSSKVRDRLKLSQPTGLRLRRWVNRAWAGTRKWISAALKAGKAMPEAEQYAQIGEVLVASAENLIPGVPHVRREDVLHQLQRIPENRRLIVLIDDLDRVTPDLVPHLLLTLREVLDLPRCAFVVAIDPQVVSVALAAVHPGWGSAPKFLQKIIQFPFWLAPAETSDMLNLVRMELESAPVTIDAAPLEEVIDLLPRNPRELKEFFRGLWRLTPALKRHGADEMKWPILLIVEILRATSPQGSWVLLRNDEFRKALAVSTLFPTDSDKDPAKKAAEEPLAIADRLLKAAGIDDSVRERALAVVAAARTRLPQTLEPNLRYWATLEDDPPIFTWKEFNALLAEWQSNLSEATFRGLVAAHAAARGLTAEAVWADLFKTTVEYRESLLAGAADEAITTEELKDALRKADSPLQILRLIVDTLNGFGGVRPLLSASHLKQLYDHASRWAHFTNTPEYRDARAAERALIILAAERGEGLAPEFLSERGYWMGREGGQEPPGQDLFRDVTAILEKHVARGLMERLTRDGGIRSLWGRERHLAEKYVLFRRESPLYTPERRARIIGLATQATKAEAIRQNALEYIRLLGFGFTDILQPLSRPDLEPLAKDTELIGSIWKAAASLPLQPRIAGSLFGSRQALARAAGSDAHLPLPDWWAAAIEAEKAAQGPQAPASSQEAAAQ
jgi:hypothetical protein